MTCIVGFVQDGISYMGADSLGSNGYSGTVYKNKKVFKLSENKDILIGYTSSFRMGQLLQYSNNLFDELALLKDTVNDEYMVNSFIPNVKELFKKGGYGSESDGGCFLITFKDKLYEVQSDYSILSPVNNFSACGSGENYALGSLETTINLNMTPVARIIKALEAAEKYSVAVARPFYIINSKDDELIEIK